MAQLKPRKPESVTVDVPGELLGNPRPLVPLIPAEVWRSETRDFPRWFLEALHSRQFQAIARVRFRELTGAGHSSWRVYPENVPPATRRAGMRLAEELARE